VGNFWVDLTRATLYVLLPVAALVAIIFVAEVWIRLEGFRPRA
ncbi:hypothetical protein GHJ82_21160, partial [Sinorhizobium saheli]|nr:hypothetical protein [Sinorhizobium saheli]